MALDRNPHHVAISVLTKLPRLLRALSPRQRRMVVLRFYRNLSHAQIAATVGLSQLQVARQLRSALRQMQVALLAGQ